LTLEKVTDRVYASINPAGGNAGIIILQNQVAAVDSQFLKQAKELRRQIEQVTPKKISHLLLTHSHSDHVFGNEVFRDCEIVSHRSLKARMEELLGTTWSKESLEKQIAELRKTDPERASRFEGVTITLPTHIFDKDFRITDGDQEVVMTHVGGHTTDSSIVHFPAERILFSGDLIFCKTFPYGGDPTADPDQWLQALRDIMKMSVDIIVPGHGPICDKREVQAYIDFIETVKKRMTSMMNAGKTEQEITKDEGYPEFYSKSSDQRRQSTLAQWFKVWYERSKHR
jgi:glyoxylase-like metal-dependent hydrolase (beta-lactamase superfamily II)